jgi:RNA polymerase sigma-70 factor (ECF subfamily)
MHGPKRPLHEETQNAANSADSGYFLPQPIMRSSDATSLLSQWRNGDRAAMDELFALVYDDLRRRARSYLRQQPSGHTLTTTALVHETYLKLIVSDAVMWQDRAHFMALAAVAMRQVLVSYARRNLAAKRGGGAIGVDLDAAPILTDSGAEQLLALDDALERLSTLSERMSRTVELRYFGGMTIEESAEALGVAPSTVKLDWQKARAWLYRELAET